MSPEPRPQPSIISRLVGLAGLLLAHTLALMFVMFGLVKLVPTYAIFFEHHDLSLPAATQQIVIWSEFWVAYWYLLFFLCMFVDAAIMICLSFVLRWPRVLTVYSHGCLLTASAVLCYIGAWLSHPVYDTIR